MIARVRLGLLLAPIHAMEQLPLELPGQATIAELRAHVAGSSPARGRRLASGVTNAEPRGVGRALTDGDEVTLGLGVLGG